MALGGMTVSTLMAAARHISLLKAPSMSPWNEPENGTDETVESIIED